MNETRTLIVDLDAAGQRVDAYLAKVFPEFSRARIQNLLENGHILSSRGTMKPSYRLVNDDTLTIIIPAAAPTQMQAEELTIDVLYEDEDLVVLNKPAGMVVHPGAGNPSGTLANALLFRYPDMHVGDVQRPGIVHRLDKETSGVMVCARHDAAFLSLAKQFKSREVRKIYKAFCFGKFKKESFELITGHTRHKSDRKRFTTKLEPPKESGGGIRRAHTAVKVLAYVDGVAELEVELFTGRTHQIRAHLADIHHPILQDPVYGGGPSRLKQLVDGPVEKAAAALKRHALHAEKLSFMHPTTNTPLNFHAPLPPDLQAIHDAIWRERL